MPRAVGPPEAPVTIRDLSADLVDAPLLETPADPWEAAWGYMARGYLPPAALRLVALPGPWTARHDAITRAVRASYSVAARNLQAAQVELREIIRAMRWP